MGPFNYHIRTQDFPLRYVLTENVLTDRLTYKILRNLHQLFVLFTASQMISGDFTKFCGLLRIY